MAALKENLLSPLHKAEAKETLKGFRKRGKLNLKQSESRRMELQTDFSAFQRDRHLSRAMRLQWRWQQLSERECRAHQHNRQLLQEFDRAQDTLRDMVARTAAMNTIRTEFERYLEESAPRWEQQLKEKTLSASKKRMEEYLKESLKRMEEQATSSSAHCPSLQGATKQPHDTGDAKGYLTQTPSQLARFPSTTPQYSQGSLNPTQTFHPHSIHPQPLNLLQPDPLCPMPTLSQLVPQQWQPYWATQQSDETHSWASGVAGVSNGPQTPWSHQFLPESPGWGSRSGMEGEAGPSPDEERADGGKQRRGGGRHLSQELDIKPVRLSSGHGESSDTERDSKEASKTTSSREKKKRRDKKGRKKNDESSSQGTSRTVSAASAAQGPESSTSSETERSMKMIDGLLVKPLRKEKKVKESIGSEGGKSGGCERESPTLRTPEGSTSDKNGEQSLIDNSEVFGEEEGSIHVESKDGGSVEMGSEQESINAEEERSDEDKAQLSDMREEKMVENDDIRENEESGQTDEEEEVCDEGGSLRKNALEEKTEDNLEGQESEDQGEEAVGGSEDENESHASSQDDESEGEAETEQGEDQVEEKEEKEEQLSVEAEGSEAGEQAEESDSDDSIILPQEHRPKKEMQSIPEDEEATSDEEEDHSREGSECSGDHVSEFKNEDDDIERLLAPQAETPQREEMNAKDCDTAKATGEDLECFSEKLCSEAKIPQDTDSDEFDHFYD